MTKKITEAARELWSAAADADQYPAMDYTGYITNSVIDNNTKAKHQQWAKGMQNYSGVPRNVDDLDEAVANNVSWMGIRGKHNGSKVPISNALQLTERDHDTYKEENSHAQGWVHRS
jgi:hypothetical protein